MNISSSRESPVPPVPLDSLFTIPSFIHRYENGINTFDTANVYSNGESERILGRALKEHNIPRENVVIMTKVWFPGRPPPLPSAHEGKHRYSSWFVRIAARL